MVSMRVLLVGFLLLSTTPISILSVPGITVPSVHNLDTGESFATINDAIFDPDTLDGHTIGVDSGIYYEHVVINKSLRLIGENKSTTIVDGGGVGDVISVTADDVYISGFMIRNGGPGPDWDCGINLDRAQSCTIIGNIISNNTWGVLLYYEACGNLVADNEVYITTQGLGIILITMCTDNFIIGNTINNTHGYGIYLQTDCNANVLSLNMIRGKSIYDEGIVLHDAHRNLITGNDIYNTMRGIRLTVSYDNVVYHNNFVNNTANVCGDLSSRNFWNIDYPYGGTYWSDYAGTDRYRGQHQNETGRDGIGDTPYTIDTYNSDAYPLMGPFGPLTLSGENSTVFPSDDVGVIFERVTTTGATTVVNSSVGPELPSGYQIVGEYLDLQTTATYTNKITVRIIIESYSQEDETALELMQWNESSQTWETITTHVDWVNNVVYGETNHLSIYGVTRRTLSGIMADVDVIPKTLNLKSRGEQLKIHIELPADYDVNDINFHTIMVNETFPVELMEIGDYDSDMIPDALMALNRTALIEHLLSHNITSGTTTLTLRGDLHRIASFEGRDNITISNLLGDVNCDGIVSLNDIVTAAISYSSTEDETRWNPNANYAPPWNRIDIFDLVTITAYFT